MSMGLSGEVILLLIYFMLRGLTRFGMSKFGERSEGDTAVIMSSLFERNDRGDNIEYVNIYALANVEQLVSAYTDIFNSFGDYNEQIKKVVKNYLIGRPSQAIGQNVGRQIKKTGCKSQWSFSRSRLSGYGTVDESGRRRILSSYAVGADLLSYRFFVPVYR